MQTATTKWDTHGTNTRTTRARTSDQMPFSQVPYGVLFDDPEVEQPYEVSPPPSLVTDRPFDESTQSHARDIYGDVSAQTYQRLTSTAGSHSHTTTRHTWTRTRLVLRLSLRHSKRRRSKKTKQSKREKRRTNPYVPRADVTLGVHRIYPVETTL